jgi:hypothetical protein
MFRPIKFKFAKVELLLTRLFEESKHFLGQAISFTKI